MTEGQLYWFMIGVLVVAFILGWLTATFG